jgi:hypothetical protein
MMRIIKILQTHSRMLIDGAASQTAYKPAAGLINSETIRRAR